MPRLISAICAGLILGAELVLAFAQPADDAQQKLQGTWTATKAERDGNAAAHAPEPLAGGPPASLRSMTPWPPGGSRPRVRAGGRRCRSTVCGKPQRSNRGRLTVAKFCDRAPLAFQGLKPGRAVPSRRLRGCGGRWRVRSGGQWRIAFP
jgi:hypothetical protein